MEKGRLDAIEIVLKNHQESMENLLGTMTTQSARIDALTAKVELQSKALQLLAAGN